MVAQLEEVLQFEDFEDTDTFQLQTVLGDDKDEKLNLNEEKKDKNNKKKDKGEDKKLDSEEKLENLNPKKDEEEGKSNHKNEHVKPCEESENDHDEEDDELPIIEESAGLASSWILDSTTEVGNQDGEQAFPVTQYEEVTPAGEVVEEQIYLIIDAENLKGEVNHDSDHSSVDLTSVEDDNYDTNDASHEHVQEFPLAFGDLYF